METKSERRSGEPEPEKVYAAITLRRAQVLCGLADARSEREIADALCLTLAGVRSHVEDLKGITGQQSVRELSRWWQAHRMAWLAFYAREGGVAELQIQ